MALAANRSVVLRLALLMVLLQASPLLAGTTPSREITGLEVQTFDGSPCKVAKEREKQLSVMARYADGHLEAYEGAVSWSVDDPAVAAIQPDGRVSGVEAGQTIVKVRASAGDGGLAGEHAVQVDDEPIRIFFKPPSSWNDVHLWVWYLRGRAHPSGLDEKGQPLGTVPPEGFQGGWPGPAMQPVPGARGWFFYDVPRYDSPSLRDQHLRKQPFWVIFNNPQTGQKSAEFLRDGGCFVADQVRFGASLTGSWLPVEGCGVATPPMRLVAEPAGGPFWGGETRVSFHVVGGEGAVLRYAIDELPSATASSQQIKDGVAGKTITLGADLNPNEETRLCLSAQDASGGVLSQCYAYRKTAQALPSKPGAQNQGGATSFAVWSPERRDVRLWLDGRTVPMGYLGGAVAGYSDLYGIRIEGDSHLKPYHFLIDGRVVRDPYAVMVQPGSDFNIVVGMDGIRPDGGEVRLPPLVSRTDAVIYETHVRDFTLHASSGVYPAGDRGTFRGLTRRGTRLMDDRGAVDRSIKTGLDHLLELGITHVQLMPVFDYGSCSAKDPNNAPGCYNWGYDPENFNVPEERYSAFGPTQYVERIREFKTMVNDLHKAGIGVIMDVVYNHTWTRAWREQDEGERYFSPITGQYFLHDRSGRLVDLTGTGNTLDASRPMVNRFIRDSLEFWVREYGVDGFRFDLAGSFDKAVLEEWSHYLAARYPERQLLFYGEPWVANPNADSWDNHFRLRHLAENESAGESDRATFGAFNDVFRIAIKGESDGPGGAFAFNETGAMGKVAHGLRGSVLYPDGAVNVDESIFAISPARTINYTSAHDNLTLWDKIDLWSAKKGTVPLAYKKRIQMFMGGITLTAQGVPFLLGGEEMARTKFGVGNSYESPDQINQMDWNRKRDFAETYAYYRQLIALRRAHPALRLATREEINNRVSVVSCDAGRGLIALAIKSEAQKPGEEFLLLYNSAAPFDYTLPAGSWKVAMQGGRVLPVGEEDSVQGTIRVDGTAVTVLFR